MKCLSNLSVKSVLEIGNSLKKMMLLLILSMNSILIFAAIPPPGVTKTPSDATICRGVALEVSLSGAPLTCGYVQQYMLPGETEWSPMTPGSSIAVNNVGVAQIRARIECCVDAVCDTSDWTTVSWNVVGPPQSPTTITKFPNSNVCLGATVSASASGSTGGTGSCYYLYTFFHAGRTQDGYTTTNSYTTDTNATVYVKARYYCDGYGCDTSNYNSASWTVVPDPLSPVLVKSPNLDSVCVGAEVTVTSSTNTGGVGTCNDWFRYSNDGGTNWSAWQMTIPVVTVTGVDQIIKIQGKKECDGSGCNATTFSEVTWKAISDPVWGAISISEDSLCTGGSVTLSASYSGGVGGLITWHRYYTTPSYTTAIVTSPNTPTTARTYYYYPEYVANPSLSGCNIDTGANKKLIVVSDPTFSGIVVTPSSECIGAQVTMSANLNGGLSGGSFSWIRDIISGGPGITVTSPNTPATPNVYYYRPHYIPAANARGCNLNDGTQKTVTIYDIPVAQNINGSPIAGSSVCLGSSISATFSGGTNRLGSEVNEYQYSTNGGVSWSTYIAGNPIVTSALGTNNYQIRTRKVATGTFCNTEWTVSNWSVIAGLIDPSLNVKTPNISGVCAGTLVNATVNSGNGGVGCSDVFQYSINNGSTWQAYTPGQDINTALATEVVIRGWRGNCDLSSGCSNTTPIEIARWTVTASVDAAILTPNGGAVCQGTNVSASVLTPGFGSLGCSDVFQSRFYSAGSWSTWVAYTAGSSLVSAGKDTIQIRSILTCDPLAGCADTNTYTWIINNYFLVSPSLSKQPDVITACQGTNVSASLLSAGSGGNGCSDSYQYRTNNGAWSAWTTYTLGNPIATTGLTSVEVRAWRANCASGGMCGDSTINTYSWSFIAPPVSPILTSDPSAAVVCDNDTVSATINWGAGGAGCSNFSEFRVKTGANWSSWSAYTSGQNIFTFGYSEIEIKAWIGDCLNGWCGISDTVRKSWTISENLVNPTITKVPNRASICQEESASATLLTPGSGGINCSDVFEYRTNNGAWSVWNTYTLGTNISGAGLTNIEIRASRGNCESGASCIVPSSTVISWSVIPSATLPSITRVPNQDYVCSGVSVSATINAGAGGINCTDYSEYRFNNGTSWSAWASYASGNIMSTSGKTIIQVRAFRGCQPTTGCVSSDTTVVQWDIDPLIVNPTLSKSPNVASVCDGTDVSATIAVAGSGGNGCSDIYEYSTNSGSSWFTYVPGTIINTTNLTSVHIRAYHGNCTGGANCAPIDTNVVFWNVVKQPTDPTITKIPNQNDVCTGSLISAIVVSGSGGTCGDYAKYRTYNGTTWTAWANYTSGNNINYPTDAQIVQVRAYRGNCLGTCGTSDTVSVAWNILPAMVNPTLLKNPNTATVVENSNVSATIQTPGSNGNNCHDLMEYRVDSGTGYGSWTSINPGVPISTTGNIAVQVRGFRGNCDIGTVCPPTDTTIYTWTVTLEPQTPTIVKDPNTADVCFGSDVSATITSNGGGIGCTDFAQYRTYDGTTWAAWATYNSGVLIPYVAGTTQIQVRSFRGNCDPSSGVLTSDTTVVSWNLLTRMQRPQIVKNPSLASVCDGTDVSLSVSTPGNGGVGCNDILEYRLNSGFGFGAWITYIANTPINTSGYTEVQMHATRGNCIALDECPASDTVVSWIVTSELIAPQIIKNPNQTNACRGTILSATVIPGSGGTGCSDIIEYRTYNGSAWSSWISYTSGNSIPYFANTEQVQLRTYHSFCDAGSGCTSSDTTLASWSIDEVLINPVLLKNPNIVAVCEGTNVKATISTFGIGGLDCNDILQYRTNAGAGFSAWQNYVAGNSITTTGKIEVQVRGFIGNCSSGQQCPPIDTTIYSWNVSTKPTAPIISRLPNLNQVCSGTALSANITSGVGGTGCTEYYQTRAFNGTTWSTWTAYASGNAITYGATITKVEVRAFRGNCDIVSGCLTSDTTSASWDILPSLVNPILAKLPNLTNVCEGTNVSATIQTAGSGGVGCSDILQYRTKIGVNFSAWNNYTAGNAIPTLGFSEVQVRGFIGNCISGQQCPPIDTTIYSWIVNTKPTAPTIARIPNTNQVCRGTALSATITAGTGGSGCTEYAQTRTYNGTTWSGWSAYISGNAILYGAAITKVEVRAFRGNCDIASGCLTSDTTSTSWDIQETLINPILTKLPNLTNICEGTSVSATIQTAGSGGVGCSDILQYRTKTGINYSAWNTYTAGNAIPTIGFSEVQVRGFIGNCISGQQCPPIDTTIYSWTVNTKPTAPTIARNPNTNQVCNGTALSATITPGSGGSGCSETYQSRTYDGTTYSGWSTYTSGNTIVYGATITKVEVRAFRGNCNPASGCSSSDTNMVSWDISAQPIAPVLSKNPNLASVCEGVSVSATLTTAGSGGVGCSDNFEYRKETGAIWSAWTTYVPGTAIATNGLSNLEIRSWRGGCTGGCVSTAITTLQWIINPITIEPTLTRTPDQDLVCKGTLVSATITAGSGGSGCNDVSEYRTKSNGGWSLWANYISANNINTNNADSVEIRTYRVCPPLTGCSSTDTNMVTWKISGTLVMPVMTKVPNVLTVCESTTVGANLVTAGSGGTGCIDVYEKSTDGGGTWSAYTPGTMLSTVGLTNVHIRFYRGGCPEAALCSAAPTEFVWTIVPEPVDPVITRVPNVDTICSSSPLSATITNGSGGIGCSDFSEYRLFDGTTWNAWSSYTSSANIPYLAGTTQVQVRAWRGNCSIANGCSVGDTIITLWNIAQQPQNPIISKVPDLDTVCSGNLRADLLTVGSGGSGCSDVFLYRVNNGGGYGAWNTYTLGTNISTLGNIAIQIKANRSNCIGGCTSTTDTVLTWIVASQPIEPTIIRVPNQDLVCQGTMVSGVITNGSGGSPCGDVYEYRTKVGAVWSAWSAYTSSSPISTIGIDKAEIRIYRICNPLGGCSSTDTTTVLWNVTSTITLPIMAKVPNINSVCSGTDVSATLVSAGAGGATCTDIYESRTYSGGAWSAWIAYTPSNLISTVAIDSVQIQYYRGGCIEAAICNSSSPATFTWYVSPQPTQPSIVRVPNVNQVCRGTVLSANVTAGAGGSGCTEYYQTRTYDGTAWSSWSSYISGTTIVYGATITNVEVRAFRGNCDITSGCISSDTTTVQWDILQNLINPILTKLPNVTNVCEGTNVSATIQTAGSGGVGCTDILEYRTKTGLGYGAWNIYTAGNALITVGFNEVQVRGYVGNCTSGCAPIDTTIYTWTIDSKPIAPIITKVPNINQVCNNVVLSANITSGSGGSGCTEYYQTRMYDGTTWSAWTAYTSGNTIGYGPTITKVEVRAFRGNCSPLSTCLSSDTTIASWDVQEFLVNPILTKLPNVTSLCEGTDVSATIQTAGSGGVGCNDILQYRTKTGLGYGAWVLYSSGNAIPTFGFTEVQVRGFIGNCVSGQQCPPVDTTIYSWTIETKPTAPTIARIPNTNQVCRGTALSANITSGSGGIGCTEYYETRTFDGTTWSAWTAYTSGNAIAYGATITKAEVRAFRGNCNPLLSCLTSDTTIASWDIQDQLVNPTLTKLPNLTDLCEGTTVSATIQTAGSGGVGCNDILEYRANSGAGFSAWNTYTAGNAIPTLGFTEVQVRGYVGNCASGCAPIDTTIYSWTINTKPIAPIISRVPNLNQVCNGTALSATITAGSGGTGCTEYYQTRTFDGTTWSVWSAYTSGSTIAYGTTITKVEVRAFRGNCNIITGCLTSDTTTTSWDILDLLINPTLTKLPNVPSLCEGTDVSATIQTVGSNGIGCSDILEYRVKTALGFGPWNSYTAGNAITTLGFTEVQVRGYVGNCASGCPPIDTTIYSWTIDSKPTTPIILKNPNINLVCRGTVLSANITSGVGGLGCSETYESRTFDGTTWSGWSAYTSGTAILYGASITKVEVRAYRGNCNPASTCSSSDTTITSWDIQDLLVNPILTKLPNLTNICEGTNVSATIQTAGSNGVGCSDILEYRTKTGLGYGAWTTYTAGNALSTVGFTEVQVRGYVGNCASGCPPIDTTIYSWTIDTKPTAPTITRIPNLNQVCNGTALSANITAGLGGSGCSETYESRTFDGTTWSGWSSYISASPIVYGATITKVEVRTFRGNCNPTSGCSSSDTNTVSWDISAQPIAPVLTKNPNVAGVCDGVSVSATLTTAGSGGVGCSDNFEYRKQTGAIWSAWTAYVPGTVIATTGLSNVEIRSWRGGCIAGCTTTAITTLQWTVNPVTTEPTVTRVPDQDIVCRGTLLSGIITPGTGGSGCNDNNEYRTKNGGIWSAWTAYTSGTNIPYFVNGTDSVELRTYRLCPPLTGCSSTDTNMVTWKISGTLVMPVMTKTPNVLTVCESTTVGANLVLAGSGGTGCVDVYEKSTDGGVTWSAYTPGTMLSTVGLTNVHIRFYRGGCPEAALCAAPPTEFVWTIVPQPIDPVITRIPNFDSICSSIPVSATITNGSGGIGCSNFSEFRLNNGTTWSAWSSYISGANIPYLAGTTQVQVRAWRGNCTIANGCSVGDTIFALWAISAQPQGPIISKVPNLDTVCSGNVRANLLTAGIGGSGCSDIFLYRVNNGAGYGAWNTYVPGTDISTTGHIGIQIKANRGNCTGFGCTSTPDTTITWIMTTPPVHPTIVRIPDQDLVCQGTMLSGTITSGNGGYPCGDIYEYRTKTGAVWSSWSSYTSTNPISSIGISNAEIRVYRLCNPLGSCSSTDTTTIAWSVSSTITMPIMTKVPNINGVCTGTEVSATLVSAGVGGAGCSDTYEYRTYSGGTWSAWTAYTPSNLISTVAKDSVQIHYFRGGCPEALICNSNTPATYTWYVSPQPTQPTIIRVPDVNEICNGTAISATITAGVGGSGCTDYYETRTFEGTTWSAWSPYSSGNSIVYGATITKVEARAFRGNCIANSGCISTDTSIVSWNISIPIVNPTMAKLPNIAGVCQGTPVSATLVTPGSGGLNCTDVYEYRTNNGAWSAWATYTPATPIATFGLTEVEVRVARNVCDPLNVCPPPAATIFNWTIAPQPIAPTVVKNINIDTLCAGPTLSGIITSGSGGSGCADVYEYRIKDTLGTWSIWNPYVSNTLIHTDTLTGVQIRVSRTGCLLGSGCTEPPMTQIEWVIFAQPKIPALTRIPDQDAVCETTLLTANNTGVSGGVPPTTIEYFYEHPGTWTWNPGNSFVPNANGMAYIRARAVSSGFGCVNSDWEWVSWIVDPKPTITTPADQTICASGSAQLDAIASGGYGSVAYTWEMSTNSCAGPWSVVLDSTRSTLITPALFSTTWFRVTATQIATSCTDVSSCITINVKPAPVITVSGQPTVCSGGTSLIATVVNLPNPVVYQWQYASAIAGPYTNIGTNSNTLVIPSVVGSTYYRCNVIGDTVGCTASSIPTLVQQGTIPTILAHSADTSICNGQNLTLKIAAQSIPTPTYQWYGPLGLISGANADTLYIVNAQSINSGDYYCSVMSFCDTVNTPSINVNIVGNLIAGTAITGTTHRCQGTGSDLYTTTTLNALTNQWTITPASAGTINSTSGLVAWSGAFAGTATIGITSVGCNTSSTLTLDVVVDSAVQMPIVWGDSSRCQGYSLEQYHALSPGAAGYIWSISNAGNSIINQTNGIVEWDSTFSGISIINVYTYGCNGTSPVAQFHVTTIDSVTFTQTGTQNWCSHDVKSIWISPKPYVGNTFQWYNQDGIINGQTDTVLVFNPVDISIQGQYYCRIINICGDTLYSTPDTITVHPRPLVSFTTLGVCLLDTISFTNLSSITDGTVSYEWLFGDNSTSTELNPTHIYTVADTFNIVLIGVSDWGCTNTSNQELIIHGLPQANITTIADSCNGNGRGSIMISPTFGTPPFSYINNGGASQTDSIFTPLPAGSYLITVTDSNGCKTTLPSVITQPDVLLTHFYPNNVLCYNDSSGIVDLVVTGGTLPYQYLWSTGETTEDLSNVPIGNYVVSVIDANGCFTMDSTTLIQPNPLIVDSLIVQPSCLQLNDGKIFVYASGGSGFYDYLWSTGAVSDSIINLSPNKYQITVTDGNGCKSIHDYQISTNGNDCLTIWTSFSPDGDGVNDVWNIGHIDLYPECTVQIFNRWGAQLFESKGYNQPWNGTWNNKDLPAETYYFVIKLGDGSDAITGTVTIIR